MTLAAQIPAGWVWDSAARLLAVDPSSTRTGWAIFAAGEPLDAGYYRVPRQWVATARIDGQCADLAQTLRAHVPQVVVCEMPSGKQHGRLRGRASGLTVYGRAAGELRRLALERLPALQPEGRAALVLEVADNVWTRGRPKAERVQRMRLRYPAYARLAPRDGGGDVADALGIGGYAWAQLVRWCGRQPGAT